MRYRPVIILAFLALGYLLIDSPSQLASARWPEIEVAESSGSLTHRIAMPLLLDNIQASPIETAPQIIDPDLQILASAVEVQKPLRWTPAGEIEVPILMYHHVADFDPPFQYAVPIQAFEEQIQSLQTWGYTTIPIATLEKALTEGAYLPERPIVITFDDGYMDVYENAFPVMQRFGYQGVAYIIAGQVEIGGFMHADQLKELVAAGWEIGSHTYHHLDLRQPDTNLQVEISNAKDDLETWIDGPVDTFSFPYGLTSPYATSLVEQAGFQSAVGLGGLSRHIPETRLYLSRIEVQGDFNLNTFAGLLPWVGLPDTDGPFVGTEQ